MTREEKYHIDWLLSQDESQDRNQQEALEMFLVENPKTLKEWSAIEFETNSLKKSDFSFSEHFESNVMFRWKKEKAIFYDKASFIVAYAGVAAAVLLMINLFVGQDTLSIDALLGIADMDSENTNLLFYID